MKVSATFGVAADYGVATIPFYSRITLRAAEKARGGVVGLGGAELRTVDRVEGSRAGAVVCGGCGRCGVLARHNIALPLNIPLNQAEMPLESTETQKAYTDMPKAVQLILGAFKREIELYAKF